MRLVEHLRNSLLESDEAKIKELEKKLDKVEDKAGEAKKKADDAEKEANKAEESIKDEKSFKEYAKKKFEKVFGDDLDKKKMNETIEGILKDNKDTIEKGDWGELVGILNKSFGK